MSGIINIAFVTSITAGPISGPIDMDLQPPVQLQGPTIRVVEGRFAEDINTSQVRFFEQGAELPPMAEAVAVMTRSGVMGRVVRVMPDAENDLRLVADRPDAFDIVDAAAGDPEADGVVAILDDEDGLPLAYVTSDRTDVVGVVVTTPEFGVEVVQREPGFNGPIDLDEGDAIIGLMTANPRGGVNALMDHVNIVEVQMLIEMHQVEPGVN